MPEVIWLHADAPAKPAVGEPCNGCGVCCTSEPCPLGALVSRRTSGACDALTWKAEEGRYRCGLVEQPASHLPAALGWAAAWLGKVALRHISAGSGCDCSLSVTQGLDDVPF